MTDDSAHQLGRRIRDARRARELTQDDLGNYCGMTGTALSKWERGCRAPTAANLERVARRLGVSVHWLVTGEGRR